MPRDLEGRQPSASDDFHLHANVLHLHELEGKFQVEVFLGSLKNLLVFQLNIHRFKVLARFGLMHVFATNICVWIRTLVLESLKEITSFYMVKRNQSEPNSVPDLIAEDIQRNVLKYAGMTMGVELGPGKKQRRFPVNRLSPSNLF
jgi:hypothetical protein